MTSIWSFLLQTATVSLVACLLLVLKRILADKLSPRWQYAVWILLVCRILLPVNTAKAILIPLPVYLETLKGTAESYLISAYSAQYLPIASDSAFPIITALPVSITDWLFIVYCAGVIISLLYYFISYLRLRRILSYGMSAPETIHTQISLLRESYRFPSCRVICVEGLPSAFICGVFRPILAIPSGKSIDDKILLHELLHLKYRDPLQSIVWCLFRSLHWCNPFLQYVFNRIGNDMETLCDQRVLELLIGEERREYGFLLLQMANERYSRTPGTSSISNGGQNISRRIQAIARFKKYPQGMALVSVCILCILASPVLAGTASAFHYDHYRPVQSKELDAAMAMARINRCTTIAGALDAYAKGLLYNNGIYLAMASSLSEHPKLEAEMRFYCTEEDWVAYHIDNGKGLDYIGPALSYKIYDLTENPDHSYSAWLAFPVTRFRDENNEGYMRNENGEVISNGSVLIPVTIRTENGWIVEEAGERILSLFPLSDLYADSEFSDLPIHLAYHATGKTGSVSIISRSEYKADNSIQQTAYGFWEQTLTSEIPVPDTDFQVIQTTSYITYTINHTAPNQPKTAVSAIITSGSTDDAVQGFTETVSTIMASGHTEEKTQDSFLFSSSGSSSNGESWITQRLEEDWQGVLDFYNNKISSPESDAPIEPPQQYTALILWDGKLVETLDVKETSLISQKGNSAYDNNN